MTAIPRATRVVATLLDHFAMTIVAMICSIPYLIVSLISSSAATPTSLYSAGDLIGGQYWFLGLFGFAVYLCKDSIRGRSFAKRIFKWHVVDNRTNQVAGPLRCVVRNFFIILWPIELIVLLITPARRIGDYCVGTRVDSYSGDQNNPRVDLPGVIASFCIAYLFLVLVGLAVVHFT